MDPPFKPKVDNEMQTHMFESEFTDQTPKDTPVIKADGFVYGYETHWIVDITSYWSTPASEFGR